MIHGERFQDFKKAFPKKDLSMATQPAFTCSKLTIEQVVKYVQS